VDLQTRQTAGISARLQGFAPRRTIVLVGLMGAGKTKIGRRLAARLNLPFFDSDTEIEAAAGETIEEIFRMRGEGVFRDGERRVIARLLTQPVHVLATGGGAFMDAATRDLIRRRGVSVWLRADLEVLLARVARRNNRPLLEQGDRRAVLAELIERRYPTYAEADLIIDSGEGSLDSTTAQVVAALADSKRAARPPDEELGLEVER
jgi:shikimate kinase